MKEIPLTQGKVALVDDADYEYLNQWKWCAHKDPNGCWYAERTDYAEGSGNQKCVSIHRQLLGAPKGLEVDHKDGDGLNNQRRNLRECSHRQNSQNRKPNQNSVCGYKGVTWRASRKKWRARITVDGAQVELGFFGRAIDAAITYDEAAQRYFGEFARLNFSYDPACFI